MFEWSPSGLVADDNDFRQWQITDRQHEIANSIANEVYRRLLDDLGGSENVGIRSK